MSDALGTRAADTVGAWLSLVDEVYPERHAADWDAPGLQVGDPSDAVDAVLVSLDVTAAVIAEAVERGAQMVIAHHPLLLHGLRRLTPETPAGATALAAARAGVAVAAAHTNLDVAVPGTSHPVARILSLHGTEPLRPLEPPVRRKLTVFVPRSHTGRLLDAIEAAGAGRVGAYRGCAFVTAGTGVFRPVAGARPSVGQVGERSEVPEDRVEAVIDAADVDAVLRAVDEAHPYEEVVRDLVTIDPARSWTSAAATVGGLGLGLVGDLDPPLRLGEVARQVAVGLPAPTLRLAGDPERTVTRVAVCGGAGQSVIGDALRAGADVLVTADLRHHPTLDALGSGLALIDADHHAMESAALPDATAALSQAARRRGLSARLLASATTTAPWVAPGRWHDAPQPSRAEPDPATPRRQEPHP